MIICYILKKCSSNKFLHKQKLTYFQCFTSMEDGPLKLLVHKHAWKIRRREEGNEENHMAAIILLNKKDGSC